DVLLEHRLVLHLQLAAHREVVVRARPAHRRHVEAREVAAGRAPVPGDHAGSLPIVGRTPGGWPGFRSARRPTRPPRPRTCVRLGSPGVQRSFDDLGTPLHEVTFCVVDLETTGGSPATCAITEVGAARFRGGECTGTFQTLVNPG